MTTHVIHTKVIKMGNAQGVRLPKALLEMSHIQQDAEVSLEQGAIVIRAPKKARAGWKEAFALMGKRGDDKLYDDELPTQWDLEGWQWP
ncbi:MAG: AbrB/MazE/SpoVT family DNA-binding domain-containing protein [Alphaproteobacteria bacterium]